MDRFGLLATLHARVGKESEAEAFLKSAQPLVEAETGTRNWYALKLGPSTFGIFDTFADDPGREAHLNGAVAKALLARAEELFASPPQISKVDILASKTLSA